jgi:hypothetical protein
MFAETLRIKAAFHQAAIGLSLFGRVDELKLEHEDLETILDIINSETFIGRDNNWPLANIVQQLSSLKDLNN